ncbi:hypothetical protein NPIL_450131 [Nephila pilipes]|uniref:Uncharacterized protein n=1 Tax=Nephila pilipes TaxID=299642 RepID=A0A8X6QZN2_NEPPI|nr:hypothetical protein NPIL_450131 [Nephila pilipes]
MGSGYSASKSTRKIGGAEAVVNLFLTNPSSYRTQKRGIGKKKMISSRKTFFRNDYKTAFYTQPLFRARERSPRERYFCRSPRTDLHDHGPCVSWFSWLDAGQRRRLFREHRWKVGAADKMGITG